MRKPNPSRDLASDAKEAIRVGRREHAAALVGQAREHPPFEPEALRTLADVALVLHDVASAADLLELAITNLGKEPAPPQWYRVLGETRTMEGRLDNAIRAFRSALIASPEDADTWRWLGRVLRTVGDLPAAIAAWRRVLALRPEEWQARNELAAALVEVREFDEAAALLDEAAARAGDNPAVAVSRAKLDALCGRKREAMGALEACVARHPRHLPALVTLARALRDEDRFDEAVAALERAVMLAPGDATSWCALGRTFLESGRGEKALGVARAYSARQPGHAGALALESLAHLAIGEGEAAARLLDYGRLISTHALPLPDGFPDLASFNARLAAMAIQHPTLHRAPVSHATAEGLHSGSLLVDAREPIPALQRSLRVAVAEYCRALSDLPEHPFVTHQPKSAFFDIWCVVLERGGHQVPHIHPHAWLSGVYYPQLPEALRFGEGPGGWLEFGNADHDFPRRIEPPTLRVRPEEGLLVLFPSYFYHRTIPFDFAGTRVSIAFDLVPTKG